MSHAASHLSDVGCADATRAVTMADAYVNYGLAISNTPVLTGPGIVDSANIDATLAGAGAGYR